MKYCTFVCLLIVVLMATPVVAQQTATVKKQTQTQPQTVTDATTQTTSKTPMLDMLNANIKSAAINVNQAANNVYKRVSNYMGYNLPPEEKKPPQARYCYTSFNDILCYSKPLPGEEHRLIAYQQETGKTAYTITPQETEEARMNKKVATVSIAPVTTENVSALPVKHPLNTAPVKNDSASPSIIQPPKAPLKEIKFNASEFEPKSLGKKVE